MSAQIYVGRVVTANEGGDVHASGAVVVDGSKIVFVGQAEHLPEAFAGLPSKRFPLITPGLVDAHTHAAWVGSRHDEYAMKLAGEGYEAIAARGGGIVASMRAIEAAPVDQIAAVLRARLARMASLGVTSVEVKSGYGLRPALERKQLEAIARVANDPSLPRVVPTYLALHALPPEARTGPAERAEFVAEACATVASVARDGLAHFVDAYVDRNAFTVDEARKLADAAHAAKLGLRMHVGQFADVGGAELAAERGARSVDHLENVSEAGIKALAASGVAVALLPIASFVLGQAPPNIALLRSHGLRFIVASDANPGTAPSESLPLAMAFAARLYGLTLDEILPAVTRSAAESLGLGGHGRLVVGAPADLVGWDLPHEAALIQPWGVSRAALVLRDGRPIHQA